MRSRPGSCCSGASLERGLDPLLRRDHPSQVLVELLSRLGYGLVQPGDHLLHDRDIGWAALPKLTGDRVSNVWALRRRGVCSDEFLRTKSEGVGEPLNDRERWDLLPLLDFTDVRSGGFCPTSELGLTKTLLLTSCLDPVRNPLRKLYP